VSDHLREGRERPSGFDPVLSPADLDDLGVKSYDGTSWVGPPEPPPSPGDTDPGYDDFHRPPKEGGA
jgi:hypothetical protein